MLSALVHLAPVLATEKSKVPFYLAGGALALWAVIVSLAIGLRRPDFPSNDGAQRLVMAVTAVLVVLTATTAVLTSGGEHNTVAAVVGGTAAGGNVGTGPAATGGTPAPASSAPSAPAASSTLTESANPTGVLAYTKPTLQAKAGRVTINFSNMSPLMHNMTIAQGSTVLAATPTFQGGSHTLSLVLKPGTYVFYCSVPGHRQAGMQGTLTVS